MLGCIIMRSKMLQKTIVFRNAVIYQRIVAETLPINSIHRKQTVSQTRHTLRSDNKIICSTIAIGVYTVGGSIVVGVPDFEQLSD